MKLRFFGKETEIRKEAALIGISALALLGMLIGYIFFRDTGDIIIEAGGDRSAGGLAASADGSYLVAAGKSQASVKAGSDSHEGSVPGGNVPGGGNRGNGTSTGGTSGGVAAGGGTSGGIPGGGSSAGDGSNYNNTDNDAGKIKIYVVGCVRKPGIVTLEKGSMICDAVREAGGLTEDADSDNINMVYSLNENVMLYIKSKKEESDGLGKGAAVVSDSGTGAEVIGKGDDAADEDRIVHVNINTAGVDELDTLPGIGEATARDIIAYREKNGGFSTIEDIMRVPRIKENRFESIRDYITVE
jgi:competence protein ComEA